jgi:alpha-methylacyl-CoA racemase
MVLADIGADVVRFERPDAVLRPDAVTSRGRRLIEVDLRAPEGRAVALSWLDRADAAVEGFRPGTLERLGLGPDVVTERNPRIVFARATGWGTTGPLANTPSHDINGLALSGVLDLCRLPGDVPFAPPMVIGDDGGGGLMLVIGVVAALLEARTSGRGQVVESSILSGAASLAAPLWGLKGTGAWSYEVGTNIGDGGSPFNNVYECADGKYIAVGAIEPHIYEVFVTTLGLPESWLSEQLDRSTWQPRRRELATLFRTRNRDDWTALFEGADAAVTPVLDFREAAGHPHNVAQGTFASDRGIVEPAVTPRFSRTPGAIREPTVIDRSDEPWPARDGV